MRVNYRLHGVGFSLDAEAGLVDELRQMVMPGAACAGAARGMRFAVRREGRGFALWRGGLRLWAVKTRAELLPWVESEVMNWLLGRLGGYVQLHAAAVERGGRAAVIPGAPDSGKTSLACALALGGWRVMSDEVALVRPGTGCAYSFPRAMLVKAGTCRRLPALRRVRPTRVMLPSGAVSVRYVSPHELCGRARDRARVAALVFPEWSRRADVSEMGEREALERVLAAVMNGGVQPARTVRTCVGLVRGARRVRLGVGDLIESARMLSEALEAEWTS